MSWQFPELLQLQHQPPSPPTTQFGPFLGSVPSDCNLDECCSLAFGLINNNINSNYSDRLINSLKKSGYEAQANPSPR